MMPNMLIRLPIIGKEEERLWLLSFPAGSVPGQQPLYQCTSGPDYRMQRNHLPEASVLL